MRKIKTLLLTAVAICILGTAAGCADRTESGNGILDDAVDDVTDGVDDVTDDITNGVDKAADEMTEDNGADNSDTQRNR